MNQDWDRLVKYGLREKSFLQLINSLAVSLFISHSLSLMSEDCALFNSIILLSSNLFPCSTGINEELRCQGKRCVSDIGRYITNDLCAPTHTHTHTHTTSHTFSSLTGVCCIS